MTKLESLNFLNRRELNTDIRLDFQNVHTALRFDNPFDGALHMEVSF